MSPIFVRPVREQLEHDRLIRHLAAKYKKKFEVAVNLGDEQIAPVKIGPGTFFPDLVLTAGRKLEGLVEVETGESINNLEAMAQWVHFAKARAPFHLYVPVPGYDAAKRLADANHARVTEIWTYRPTFDGFDLVRMFADTAAAPRGAKVSVPATSEVKTPRPAGAVAAPAKAPAKTATKVPAKPPAAKAAAGTKAAKPASKTAKPARRPAPPARKKSKPAPKKSASARKK